MHRCIRWETFVQAQNRNQRQSTDQSELNKAQALPHAGMLVVSLISLISLGYAISLRLSEEKANDARLDRRFGTVVSATLGVERTQPNTLVWKQLTRGDALSAKEKIRTSPTGTAHWRLAGGGGDIRVQESTTVELDRSGAQLSARLANGRISIENAASLFVYFSQGMLKLVSASAIIESKAGSTTLITVRKGRANLHLNNKIVTLAVGETALVEVNGSVQTKKFAVTLGTPSEGEVLSTADQSMLVGLHWTPEQPAILTWEIASSPTFQNIVQRGLSHDGRATVRLAPGIYYWRVWDEKAVSSYTGRFAVANSRPVKLILPARRHRVSFWREVPQLAFEWEAPAHDVSDQASYRVELSGKRDFSDNVTSLQAQSAEGKFRYRAVLGAQSLAALGKSQSSELHWRVATEFPSPRHTIYSETRTISLEKRPGIEAPRLLFPKDGAVEVLSKDHLILSWLALPEARQYRVFVWQKGKTRSVEPTFVVNTNLVKLARSSLAMRQAYEWTVAPVGANGEVGGFAKKRAFEVFGADLPKAPALVEPLHGAIWSSGKESDLVRFAWSKVEGAKLYTFVVEKRETESDWVNVFTKTFDGAVQETSWKPESIGSYRWWVIATDELDRNSEQSKLTEFEVVESNAPKLPAPKISSIDEAKQ